MIKNQVFAPSKYQRESVCCRDQQKHVTAVMSYKAGGDFSVGSGGRGDY